MRYIQSLLALMLLCGAFLWANPGLAQQYYVYPTRGQSPQQESFDKAECFNWAVQQTGFNPSNPPPMAPPPPPMQGSGGFLGGGMVGGAAGGAALGSVGGAIAGDAGKGAAIGAATGALFGLFRRHREMEEEQQQQQQQQQYYQAQQQAAMGQGRANWGRAYQACLNGRGYTVM